MQYLDLLKELLEQTPENSPFRPFITWLILIVIIGVLLYGLYKFILLPLYKCVVFFISCIKTRNILKKMLYDRLSQSEDISGRREELEEDMKAAIRKFIQTRFSSTYSGTEEEPTDYETENNSTLIRYLLNESFDKDKGIKYHICFSDCGMGKTTFLLNLWYNLLSNKKHKSLFIDGGIKGSLSRIEKCEDKGSTVLLFDALDEVPEANTDYDKFLEDFENVTKNFYKVVLTCRTNFFPTKDKELQITLGRIPGMRTFDSNSSTRKYYISPFSKKDIVKYINKHYGLSLIGKKKKKKKRALEIATEECMVLSARPIMLYFIDILVSSDRTFSKISDIYAAIFDEWVIREVSGEECKLTKEEYAQNCYKIAKYLYYKWMQTGESYVTLDEFSEDKSIYSLLKNVNLKGHAFLNRTATDNYKFAHKSFFEYLVAQTMIKDYQLCLDVSLEKQQQIASFFNEICNDSKEGIVAKSIVNKINGNYETALKQFQQALFDLPNMSLADKLFIKQEIADCQYFCFMEYSSLQTLIEINQIIETNDFIGKDLILLRFYNYYANILRFYSRPNDATKLLDKGINHFENFLASTENQNSISIRYETLKLYHNKLKIQSFGKNFQKQLFKKFQDIVKKHFDKDNYAQYWLEKTEIGSVNYDLSDIENRIIQFYEKYSHFMPLLTKLELISSIIKELVDNEHFDEIDMWVYRGQKYIPNSTDKATNRSISYIWNQILPSSEQNANVYAIKINKKFLSTLPKEAFSTLDYIHRRIAGFYWNNGNYIKVLDIIDKLLKDITENPYLTIKYLLDKFNLLIVLKLDTYQILQEISKYVNHEDILCTDAEHSLYQTLFNNKVELEKLGQSIEYITDRIIEICTNFYDDYNTSQEFVDKCIEWLIRKDKKGCAFDLATKIYKVEESEIFKRKILDNILEFSTKIQIMKMFEKFLTENQSETTIIKFVLDNRDKNILDVDLISKIDEKQKQNVTSSQFLSISRLESKLASLENSEKQSE